MKNRIIALLLCSVMATSILAGCSKENGSPASEKQTEASGTEQIANPIEVWDNMDELAEAAGFSFDVPDSYENYQLDEIRTIDRSIIEMVYKGTNQEDDYVYLRKARGGEDISGDYNDYDAEVTIWAGDYEVTGKGNEGWIKCATWQSGEYTYAGNFPDQIWEDEMVASLITVVMEFDNPAEAAVFEGDVSETGSESAAVDIPGPYGTICLTLPAGWKYSICQAGESEMASAEYGIRFLPAEVSMGWLELGYTTSFGVCGTGLVSIQRTLSGVEATEGHFDDNKNWDFISFHGELEGIVAIQNQADDWIGQYDEQITSILNTLEFDAGAAQGAIGVYDPASELESLGLQVIVSEVSSTSAVVTYCQYDDTVSEELSYGNGFYIEVRKGETWEAYPIKNTNYDFTAEAFIIDKNAISEKKYDWTDYYGSLPAGDYRLKLTVYADNKPYDGYASFIVR